MPDEDGLPSYEEATGLERMLPHNIGKEITRAISQSQEDSDSSLSKCGACCCFLLTVFLFLLGLGILMIVVGSTTMSQCWDSMLPTWLLAMGIAIVAAYVVPLLICCCEAIASIASWLLAVDAVFCLLWFCCGCYWTWLDDNADCVPHVFWLALFVTILPAISCILCFCRGCVIPCLT